MKSMLKVLLGVLLLSVAVNCEHGPPDDHHPAHPEPEHDRWDYNWEDYDDDDYWLECEEDYHCEMRDALFNTDKRECCDGECREHCGTWWGVLLFLLLCIGCCLGCLGAIAGVVYCAVYAANKKSMAQRSDPTMQTQNYPNYTMNAYGAPPAYNGVGAPEAGPLPPKM